MKLPNDVKDRLALIRRFVSYTKLSPTGCVEWTRSVTTWGYGAIRLSGKSVKAHRLSALLAGMDIDGLHVCHTCDNRRCVNPEHLFVGTRSDNMVDMVRKGRQRHQKLNETDVLNIRRLLADGLSQRKIAALTHMSQNTIKCINRRITWKHI